MTKVKGSKNGKIITASFDGISKQWFPALNNTKALVLLSIKGNEFCVDHYLSAIIKHAIATHEFVTFLVADEVHWHKLKEKNFVSEQEPLLRQSAIALGAKYFERNLHYFLQPLGINVLTFNNTHTNKSSLQKIKILSRFAKEFSNFEVLTWQDWVNDEEYQAIKKTMLDLYDTTVSLKESIDITAKNYVSQRKNITSEEIELQKSKSYLIEECPAIIWLGAKRNYHFIVYPGEMVEALEKSKHFFIVKKNTTPPHPCCLQVEKPNQLLNWLEVNFKKKHTKESSLNFTHDTKTPSVISEIIKGVALAIFTLPNEEEEKINLLVKFLAEYLKRIASQKIEQTDIQKRSFY